MCIYYRMCFWLEVHLAVSLDSTDSTFSELQTKANFASMEAGAVILGFLLHLFLSFEEGEG